MKLYIVLISLISIIFPNNLLAFGLNNIGFRIGFEPALETYFITHSKDEIWDSREPSQWIFNRWNGQFETLYKIHRNMNMGIIFKTMRIKDNQMEDPYIFGLIGINGEFSYHWKSFSAFSGFSLGTWMHLSKEKWVKQKQRYYSEIKVGIGYKLLNKIDSQIYINRDFIHYKWGEGWVDTYTWYYMWSVGLSITFYPF